MTSECSAWPFPRSLSLEQMAEGMFGDLVKAVVDVEQGIITVDGELHSDEEALLPGEGSKQGSLSGINSTPPSRIRDGEVLAFAVAARQGAGVWP